MFQITIFSPLHYDVLIINAFQLPRILLLCHTDCTQTLSNALAGTDYIVNLQDFFSRDFTVTFLPKQANSTENVITIADDHVFEGREYFRLRISAVRPIGQAAQFFVAQAGVNNTFVDISIEDDDSKSSTSSNCSVFKIAYYKCSVRLLKSQLFLVAVQVNWTISRAISVTEGDVVELRGKAFGLYANEVAIGVDCSETIATDVEPGMDTISVTDASMLLVRVV